MKSYELSIICDSLQLKTKDSWEQARMIAYLIAQTNSKKKLKPSDIIQFAWDKNSDGEVSKNIPKHSLTLDEVERIKQQALLREKELKEKGII